MTILGIPLSDWAVIAPAVIGVIYWFVKLERAVNTLEKEQAKVDKFQKECMLARERQHQALREHTDERYDKVISLLMEIQLHLGMVNGKSGAK